MLELFQYTACRSLALDRCKFASASVTRLRENVARAIIPLRPDLDPLLVPLRVPAPSVPGDASFTTSPLSLSLSIYIYIYIYIIIIIFFFFQVPSYLNDRLDSG